MSDPMTNEEIDAALDEIALDPSPLKRDTMIKLLAKKLGCSITAVKAEVRQIQKGKAELAKLNKAAAAAAQAKAAGKPHLTVVPSVQDPPEVEAKAAETDPLETEVRSLFADLYHRKFAYNHNTGLWFLFDGKRWREDEKLEVFDTACLLVHGMRLKDPEARRALGKISFIDAVVRSVRTHPNMAYVTADFDSDPLLVGTPSGYLDLNTGIHHGPDATKMITKCLSVDPAPTADCPIWKGYLQQAMGDKEGLVDYMQRFAGYCLSGLMHEEILTFLYGTGGNGKGVFINVMSGVLGDYYKAVESKTFVEMPTPQHATEIATMVGARLITASEFKETDKWNVARIKELTGNEGKVAARLMRQDFFNFKPTGKLMLVGNQKPDVGDVDEGISRRLRLIPMTNHPSAPDLTLKHRLVAEYPAIARWFLDGWAAYQKEGLNPPKCVSEASKEYLSAQDVVGNMIREAMQKTPGGVLVRSDCKLAIRAYLHQIGRQELRLTTRKLYRALEEQHGLDGNHQYGPDRLRCYTGIRLREDTLKVMRQIAEKEGRKMADYDANMVSGAVPDAQKNPQPASVAPTKTAVTGNLPLDIDDFE